MFTHSETACNGFVVLPHSPPSQAQRASLPPTPRGEASRRETNGKAPGPTQQQKSLPPTLPTESPPSNARGGRSLPSVYTFRGRLESIRPRFR